MCKNNSFCVIFSFFQICLFVVIIASAEECLTPRNTTGDCKVITSCEPLFKFLKKRPITSEAADFLKRSQCGFVKQIPKVCCPPVGERILEESVSDLDDGPITSDLLPNIENCGIYTDERIIGGDKAGLLEFPWMVLIGYQKKKGGEVQYNCGGTLVNSRYVVTAAHCVNGSKIQEASLNLVSVRMGEYNKKTDPDCDDEFCTEVSSYDVPIKDKILHEKYSLSDRNFYHDIALLRLEREVEFTDYVRPICLPNTKELLGIDYSNRNLTVAGWGQTEDDESSDIKLKLQIPVRTEEYCKSLYSRAKITLKEGQICAGGFFQKDSCKGDSGGPLMTLEHQGNKINWYLIGVVSIGPDQCGTTLWPGVYTKVASYVRWIVKNIKP